MSFERSRLPEPQAYYEGAGLRLVGGGKWRTAECPFHGGSDSLRIRLETGGFVCMSLCGARGGDVLAFEMALSGDGFVACARRLGAWIDDGRQERRRKPSPRKPSPFTPREALEVCADEINFAAVALTNFSHGAEPTDAELARLRLAAGRLATIKDWVNS